MKHIVVDLEMNNIRRRSEARKICTNEIIEIGASMLDENLWEIGKFQLYVKPEYNDVIVPKISRLTGITNEMVANAPTFSVAFQQFTDWCLNIKDDVMIYAWSNTDYSQVMKEIPIERLLLETDESNVPIDELYNRAAAIRHISAEELKLAVLHNVNNVFGVKKPL